MPKRIRLGNPFPDKEPQPAQNDWYTWAMGLVDPAVSLPPPAKDDGASDACLQAMLAPVEPVACAAREYLGKAGLPDDPGMYSLSDPQRPGWVWNGMLDDVVEYRYGKDSAEYRAAHILAVLAQLRTRFSRQDEDEDEFRFESQPAQRRKADNASVAILMGELSASLEHPQLARFFTLRGRRPGSKGMPEAEFRQRYPEKYEQLCDSYASQPHRYEVAAAIGIDVKTFREYLRDYKLPFPPF